MKLYSSERTVILVDGANFHNAMKANDAQPDYKKLHEYFASKCVLVEAVYYARTWQEQDDETKENDFKPLQPLLDYLSYNGWRVEQKRSKEVNGVRTGDCDVEIASDIVAHSHNGCGAIWLFSGKGDFLYPVQIARVRGAKVCVVSSIEPPMCSDALRREATGFVDVKALLPHIRREK